MNATGIRAVFTAIFGRSWRANRLAASKLPTAADRQLFARKIAVNCGALSSFVALFVLFVGANASQATPIRYTVDWIAGVFDQGDPLGLTGASFHLELEMDTATIGIGQPVNDWTDWFPRSSTAQLTLTGSNIDGTYPPWNSWTFPFSFIYSRSSLSELHFPPQIDFYLHNYYFLVNTIPTELIATFRSEFVTVGPDGTVRPFAFENSDVISWSGAGVTYFGTNYSHADGRIVSGRAEFIPEPPSFVLTLAGSALGFLGLKRFSGRSKARGFYRGECGTNPTAKPIPSYSRSPKLIRFMNASLRAARSCCA